MAVAAALVPIRKIGYNATCLDVGDDPDETVTEYGRGPGAYSVDWHKKHCLLRCAPLIYQSLEKAIGRDPLCDVPVLTSRKMGLSIAPILHKPTGRTLAWWLLHITTTRGAHRNQKRCAVKSTAVASVAAPTSTKIRDMAPTSANCRVCCRIRNWTGITFSPPAAIRASVLKDHGWTGLLHAGNCHLIKRLRILQPRLQIVINFASQDAPGR